MSSAAVAGEPDPQPGLQADADGRIVVTGPVTFATAADLLEASQGLFAGRQAVTVDLGPVTRVDSACLALLLEWLRHARREGRTITYTGLPEKLVAIAKLSGVESMLNSGSAAAA